MIDKKIKLLLFFFLTIFVLQKSSNGIENKIIYKINNDIITSIDIKNEINYLLALNPNLKKLNKKEIISISKKSIVREKIKRIEISNRFKNANIPQPLLEQLLENIYKNLGLNNLEDFKKYLAITM